MNFKKKGYKMNEDKLKFRVWDCQTKSYIDERDMAISNGTLGWINEKWFDIVDKKDDFVVEQCIGIKDVNGKLAYEGDIVMVCISNSQDNYSKGIFIWDNGSFIVREEDGTIFDLFHLNVFNGQSDRIEILGNIHEMKNN